MAGWTALTGWEKGVLVAAALGGAAALGWGTLRPAAPVPEPVQTTQPEIAPAPASPVATGPTDPEGAAPPPATDSAGPVPETADAGDAEATAEAAASSEGDVAAAVEAEGSEPVVAEPVPPIFDTVRHGADGSTVIAGRAAPGAEVAVLVDGAEADRVRVDRMGAFAAVFGLPQAMAPRVVTLRAHLDDGRVVEGTDSVILAPSAPPTEPESLMELAEAATGMIAQTPAGQVPDAPVPPAEPVVGVLPEVTAPPAAEEAPVAAASAEAEPEAAVEEAETPAEPSVAPASEAPAVAQVAAPGTPVPPQDLAEAPAAPAAPAAVAPAPAPVLIAGDQGVRVMDPAPPADLVIDLISYDGAGAVSVSGRGGAGAAVRIYLDNALMAETRIGADGRWQTGLPNVTPGLRQLRADQLDDTGAVTARFETPFRREAAEVLAASTPQAGEGADTVAQVITVQPGNTLWGIARASYGDGILYVHVFEANRALIRNPDLIYPGQVFTVPDLAPAD